MNRTLALRRLVGALSLLCLSLCVCGCGGSHSSDSSDGPPVAFSLPTPFSSATFGPNRSDLYAVTVDPTIGTNQIVLIPDYGRGTPVTLADVTASYGKSFALSYSSGQNLLYLVSNPLNGHPGTVFVYTPSGQLVRSFAVPIYGNYTPNTAAVDSQGNLYVANGNTVDKYDTNGKPLGALPLSSGSVGTFRMVAVDSQDRVYVPLFADVYVFAAGTALSTIGLQGGVGELHSFVLDKNGNFYLTSYNDFKFRVWNKAGKLLYEKTDTVYNVLVVDDQLRLTNGGVVFKPLVPQ